MEVTEPRETAWVGVDIGKTHHWVCVLDADGTTLLSVKIANDEAEILQLIAAVDGLADQLVWAVDIIQKAMTESWQAALTYLERKFPARWSRRERVEHSGPEGGPVVTKIEIDWSGEGESE